MSAQRVVDFDLASVAAFLRRAHPTKTAECVAEAIDVPVETVRQWLRGVARPNGLATAALICAYGPEFLAALTPRLFPWLKRALLAERRLAASAEICRLEERLKEIEHEDAMERDQAAGVRARVGGVVSGDLGGGGGVPLAQAHAGRVRPRREG